MPAANGILPALLQNPETASRSIDYSMKVVGEVRCDQNPKGNLSPDIQMYSYLEEVL